MLVQGQIISYGKKQISDFKLSIELIAIYDYQMDIIEQATTKKIMENFYLIKPIGQSWAVLGVDILASNRK